MTIYKVRKTGEEQWLQIEAISIDEPVEKHKGLGTEKEAVNSNKESDLSQPKKAMGFPSEIPNPMKGLTIRENKKKWWKIR